MTPLFLGFVFLFDISASDVHRFPNMRYAWDTYFGLGLSAQVAAEKDDPYEWRDVTEARKLWAELHSAWNVQEHFRCAALFRLRCWIGWRAYDRGEMPPAPVRIKP